MQKKVLITGASRGLGNGLVVKFLENGFHVFACARKENNAMLYEMKKDFGEKLQLIRMDVSDTASVKKASEQVNAMTYSLDIIINNVGMHTDDSNEVLEGINVDNCLESYNVNTLGALRVTKELLPLLEKGNMKMLINISSEAGSITNCYREKEYAYCMSKAALNMQSVILQNYLKNRNIKVLAIHPGWFRSDMGGPNANLAITEAAEGVMNIIGKAEGDRDFPTYIEYTGKAIMY